MKATYQCKAGLAENMNTINSGEVMPSNWASNHHYDTVSKCQKHVSSQKQRQLMGNSFSFFPHLNLFSTDYSTFKTIHLRQPVLR